MTWMGEAPSGVLLFYTTDGTPGKIPLGDNGQYLKIIGGAPTWAAGPSGIEAEIDFGSTPVSNGTFNIDDSSIIASQRVIAVMSYAAPTGKDQDEVEMDNLIIRCVASGGGFTAFVNSDDGSYLEGKFKINYSTD